MATYVALLYSIVLTPQRRVVMADLREMAASLGFDNPRTLVSSGNLVFGAPQVPVSELEARLEPAFEAAFGRHVDIIVRSAVDWTRLSRANPFAAESAATPDQVGVRVMRRPVSADSIEALEKAAAPGEKFQIVDGDIWVVFSRDTPNSRLLATMNHKRFGIGTSRNWNTVRKLSEMVG